MEYMIERCEVEEQKYLANSDAPSYLINPSP